MRLSSYIVLIILSLAVAGYGVVVYGFMPLGSMVHPDMRVTFATHSTGVYLHIFASMLALVLGPFQFSPRLRATRIQFHRWLGRIYLGVGVLLGGLAGLYMAVYAYGGIAAKLGFACLAIAWLFTGLRAYLAIRAGKVALHRQWMVRNFALTFAAVTLRLYLPLSMVTGIPFQLAYPIIAWMCWVPNLVIAEWLFNRKAAARASII